MGKRVFVHIGRPKTGTTAIQIALADGRATLEKHGFVYPSPHAQHAFIVYSCNPHLLKGFPPSKQEMFMSVSASVRAELPNIENDVILSSEGLSFTEPRALADWLGNLDTSIIVYLREQVEWLASGYQQEVKSRAITSQFSEFINLFDVDYAKFLDKWASVFGADRIIPRIYTKELLVGNNVVTDFLSVLGIDDAGPFIANQRPDGNPSITGALLEAKLRINALGFSDSELLSATHAPLLALANEDSAYKGSVGVDPRLVQEIREKYRESNSVVARQYFNRLELFPIRPFPPYEEPEEFHVRMATEALLGRLRLQAPAFANELSKRLNASR